MAALTTPEDKGHMVLKIYDHFGTRPGEVLRQGNLLAMCAQWGWSTSDIADGIEYGQSVGWFEDGPNNSLMLTETGFSEI